MGDSQYTWWQRQKSIRWLLKRLFHVCQVDSTCPMLQLAQAVILRFLLHIKGKSARTCLTFSHLAPCQHFPPDCQMPVWALQVGPCHIPLGPNFPPELLSKDGRHHLLFSKSLIRFDASDIALKHLQLCIATSDAFVLASNKVPIVGGVGAGWNSSNLHCKCVMPGLYAFVYAFFKSIVYNQIDAAGLWPVAVCILTLHGASVLSRSV